MSPQTPSRLRWLLLTWSTFSVRDNIGVNHFAILVLFAITTDTFCSPQNMSPGMRWGRQSWMSLWLKCIGPWQGVLVQFQFQRKKPCWHFHGLCHLEKDFQSWNQISSDCCDQPPIMTFHCQFPLTNDCCRGFQKQGSECTHAHHYFVLQFNFNSNTTGIILGVSHS